MFGERLIGLFNFLLLFVGHRLRWVLLNLVAFVLPLLLRVLPELWNPQPVGWDTPHYVWAIDRFEEIPHGLLFDNRYMPLLYYVLFGIRVITGLNGAVIMKVMPPILFAFLSWTVYHYLKTDRVEDRYAFAGLLLFSSSIAALRLSWDHPKQVFGFAWVMLALAQLTPEADMSLGHWMRFIIFTILAVASHETTIIPLIFISLYYGIWKLRRRFFAFFLVFVVLGITVFIAIFKQWSRVWAYLPKAEPLNLVLMLWFIAYSMPLNGVLTIYYGLRYYLEGVEYRGVMKVFLFSMILFSFNVAGGGYIWSPWRFTALASIPMSIFAALSLRDLEQTYPKMKMILISTLILLNLVYVAPMLLNMKSWLTFPNQPYNFSSGRM